MNKLIEYLKKSLEKVKSIDWKNLLKQKSKDPIFWVHFSAYAIPLAFLLYVLYMNFLPFGYSKTFTLDVGGPNDTKVSEFYLEPSPNLSERKVASNGAPYRELNGTANVIFKPNAILKNAVVNVSVEGDDVSIISPIVNLDPLTIKWDYSWDFTKEVPKDLKSNTFIFDGATYFNGKDTRLELPNSASKFESGPFTIYAEWEPRDSEHNTQQIVGHYNWELWQNKDSVEFRVGRMNNAQGNAYSIKYPIDADFFNTKHTAVAIYNPSKNGYINLYVDDNLAGRTYFNSDKIWNEYGNQNITFGKSNHGVAAYFKGNLYKVNYISKAILASQSQATFKVKNNDQIDISLVSTATSTLKQIELNITQK